MNSVDDFYFCPWRIKCYGKALWPYKNRTLGKMSGATVSRHQKAGSTGLRSKKAGEPHRCPNSLPGGDVWAAEQNSEVLLSSGHRRWLLGTSRRLDISGQNAEGAGAVDRVPGICKGVPLSFCQRTCAYRGGNSLRPRKEIWKAIDNNSWSLEKAGNSLCSHSPQNAWGIGQCVDKGHA